MIDSLLDKFKLLFRHACISFRFEFGNLGKRKTRFRFFSFGFYVTNATCRRTTHPGSIFVKTRDVCSIEKQEVLKGKR
mgnify:CR=1 FL=1